MKSPRSASRDAPLENGERRDVACGPADRADTASARVLASYRPGVSSALNGPASPWRGAAPRGPPDRIWRYETMLRTEIAKRQYECSVEHYERSPGDSMGVLSSIMRDRQATVWVFCRAL